MEVERAIEQGEVFQECAKDCPVMVIIPPGEFWMGSRDGEGKATEYPRRKVKIDKCLITNHPTAPTAVTPRDNSLLATSDD